jgi:hypothetical protein
MKIKKLYYPLLLDCFDMFDIHGLIYRKFYKLLIIGNPQPTIPHIPNRQGGKPPRSLEIIFIFSASLFPPQAFICPEGAAPLFQYSFIPTFPIVSAAN